MNTLRMSYKQICTRISQQWKAVAFAMLKSEKTCEHLEYM